MPYPDLHSLLEGMSGFSPLVLGQFSGQAYLGLSFTLSLAVEKMNMFGAQKIFYWLVKG
jgi:hypothetical protein